MIIQVSVYAAKSWLLRISKVRAKAEKVQSRRCVEIIVRIVLRTLDTTLQNGRRTWKTEKARRGV